MSNWIVYSKYEPTTLSSIGNVNCGGPISPIRWAWESSLWCWIRCSNELQKIWGNSTLIFTWSCRQPCKSNKTKLRSSWRGAPAFEFPASYLNALNSGDVELGQCIAGVSPSSSSSCRCLYQLGLDGSSCSERMSVASELHFGSFECGWTYWGSLVCQAAEAGRIIHLSETWGLRGGAKLRKRWGGPRDVVLRATRIGSVTRSPTLGGEKGGLVPQTYNARHKAGSSVRGGFWTWSVKILVFISATGYVLWSFGPSLLILRYVLQIPLNWSVSFWSLELQRVISQTQPVHP